MLRPLLAPEYLRRYEQFGQPAGMPVGRGVSDAITCGGGSLRSAVGALAESVAATYGVAPRGVEVQRGLSFGRRRACGSFVGSLGRSSLRCWGPITPADVKRAPAR